MFGMLPNEIKAELLRRGIKLTEVAYMAGVSKEAVSQVIHGTNKYKGKKRVRPLIAEIIGVPTQKIWPDGLNKKC